MIHHPNFKVKEESLSSCDVRPLYAFAVMLKSVALVI